VGEEGTAGIREYGVRGRGNSKEKMPAEAREGEKGRDEGWGGRGKVGQMVR